MATKYGTYAGFNAYFAERGVVVSPVIPQLETEANLLVASEWIDNNFRNSFPGLKTGLREQEREWPRTGATDFYTYPIPSDAIPNEILFATYEMALINAKTPELLSANYTPEQYKSVSIDGALSVQYNQFTNSNEAQTQFKKVTEILSNILIGGGNSSSLSGVTSRA